MTYEPIKTLEIENYGCIKRAKFELSSIHALIGPNDSGKSTTLRALRAVAQYSVVALGKASTIRGGLFEPIQDGIRSNTRVKFGYADGLAYGVETETQEGHAREWVFDDETRKSDAASREWNTNGSVVGQIVMASQNQIMSTIRQRITTATLVRFDPDSLRSPAGLIPESQALRFSDDRGKGLAGIFDAIINRDAEAFALIQSNVRVLFPTVAKLGLTNINSSTKEIAVTLTDGTRIGASAMSEGLIYYLGFAALQHVSDSRLFLVEEPENGLHPARIAEVMTTLREISKTNQVVIATHSPLVVNELHGDEVTVVTRDPEKGTQGVLLKDVPRYEESSKVYQPGEFWLSYADGKFEEPLLTGKPRV